jgi:acylglycerol lipase
MIAMPAVVSTRMRPRRFVLALLVLLLAGCATRATPPGPPVRAAAMASGAFVMADGARLPYRDWLPDGYPATEPHAVILALHGFNDSRDAFEIPGPAFAAAGVAVFAPDQRGFGDAPGRGLWPGTNALVGDAQTMARLLHARFPRVPLYVLGESMGGAVAMLMAARPGAPEVSGYIMLAPAVWGRARMNELLRLSLWFWSHTLPGLRLSGAGLHIRASDNLAALIRLGEDPLTIHRTRLDTLRGLVNLMDAALAAAPHVRGPAFFLYGGRDELVPKRATAAVWHALPARDGIRLGYYPDGYHLLLRDKDRAQVIGDILTWIADPDLPLPSGTEARAAAWLARQPREGTLFRSGRFRVMQAGLDP